MAVSLARRQAHANDVLIEQLAGDAALAKTHHRKAWPFQPGWAKEVHVWPFLLRIEFLAAMIFIGTFIRGPGWQWFWPGQTWDHNRLIYEVNIDLPDIFGITSNWGKGIFGAIVVGGFFVVGGLLIHAFFRRNNPKDYKRMSLLQYSILTTFLLTMLGLPIKMLLRLLFHIKYVWITPWFNV